MTFQPGTKKIDKKYDVLFKPKKHLGTGSFGRVEKCLSKVDGKTYAVKLLQNVDMIYLDSIRSEAQAMMRAKSDYTVQLLDHFYDQETSTYVFVMPYYRKGNLSSYLDRYKKWSKLDILCFLYEMCQAFLSFNKKGACWHLDLKPDNILVKADGQYLICDFGCAKLVDNINNSRFLQISMNRGGGTTSYAAPQVILKYEGGRFSDVWSLGIILYQILYNKKPLDPIEKKAKSYPQVIKMFIEGKVKIDYTYIAGYQQIIQICNAILQPEKRLQWEQLKKIIYQCIGLPIKTEIVVNIQKFISYAQNVSKIVMGLVFYLNINQKYVAKFGIEKEVQRIIYSAKSYVSLLYRQVENTLQKPNEDISKNKSGISSFYIFPQVQQNYSIQQKQRINHLRTVAQKFCFKQYNQNVNSNFYNIKMNFENDVNEFVSMLRMKSLDKMNMNPFTEWYKIQMICSFIGRGNQDKYPGLQFADRDTIQKFAQKIVYQ